MNDIVGSGGEISIDRKVDVNSFANIFVAYLGGLSCRNPKDFSPKINSVGLGCYLHSASIGIFGRIKTNVLNSMVHILWIFSRGNPR